MHCHEKVILVGYGRSDIVGHGILQMISYANRLDRAMGCLAYLVCSLKSRRLVGRRSRMLSTHKVATLTFSFGKKAWH